MKIYFWFSFIVLFLGLLAGSPSDAFAQSDACKTKSDFFSGQVFPVDTFACENFAPWWDKCWVHTGCGPDSGAGRCPASGKPICVATGNTYIEQADVSVPGVGGGLNLSRAWNSMWQPSLATYQTTGQFGPNWRSSYEERMVLDSDHYVRYGRGDGSFWAFVWTSTTVNSTTNESTLHYQVVSPKNAGATLDMLYAANLACENYTLTFQSGEKRIFTCMTEAVPGRPTSIIDRNGNTTTLSYDTSTPPRLTTVTDLAGRHLNFAYGVANYPMLVTSVTGDTGSGISVTYGYDTHNPPRLIKVTRPDNTFVTFEYDANSLISAVKDMNGKLLESHTYDANARGLTSSQANGVDSLTISYPTQ
jgi:YD repeat-containing protein